MAVIRIFADGACRGNQEERNVGGYGALLIYGKHQREIHGGEANTTNNVMELRAVIEALKLLKRHDLPVVIYSDSAYVVNAFQQRWVDRWRLNDWRNAAKKPVENRELWEELLKEVERNQSVAFRKIKGHLSEKDASLKKWYEAFRQQEEVSEEEFRRYLRYNQRADELANQGADEVIYASQ